MTSKTEIRVPHRIIVLPRENGFEIALTGTNPDTRYLPEEPPFWRRILARLIAGWRGPDAR